ncbi:RagB/SusD family nutrient uptake outer membrane protein [Arachidicoccus soli]|uniref:RagB/SusD family nutrient uptake outer membrane protein n=1 Tax=Arachidicoccus soli TaxID=2341117 RepID=A0A386HQN1_9BACT|nr:RagB/SusD family nutrient uptake outer membrane protein [Arachidicoccus soli]AYD47751.1 RagB/SusD family nutrient uptake outer membrane protein [Arachidicoccus soli]
MKNKLLLYTAIFISLTLASCHKFLDQNPISSVTDQTSWKTDADANAGVAGCYSLIRSAFDASLGFYTYGDLPTDEFNNAVDGDFNNLRMANWAISVSSLNTYDPKLKLRVYTNFYASIQQSNRCLHFINLMPLSAFNGDNVEDQEIQRNKYIGEAYFTRAFNYFYMSRVWGDVPLDTSYQVDISSFTGQARTPQAEVLKNCISDLDIAKKFLPWKDESSSDRVVRADKGAVFALMAHVYAWEGQYDSCNAACDSVINSGSYSLLPGADYKDIYKGQSDEGIFEIAQNASTEAMNATQYSASIAFYTLATPYLPVNNVPNWQIDPSVLSKLYSDTNDIRYKNEFTSLLSGNVTYYSCIKYSNIETITNNNVNYYLSKNNIIIFRLADILLLKAEALAAQPSPDYNGALQLVNEIRTRAGIQPLTSVNGRTALIDSITAERGKELFLEGSRFYDLVRNERLTGVSQFPFITQNEFLAGKYYWPLDPSLFTLNPLLKQTSYWAQLLTN